MTKAHGHTGRAIGRANVAKLVAWATGRDWFTAASAAAGVGLSRPTARQWLSLSGKFDRRLVRYVQTEFRLKGSNATDQRTQEAGRAGGRDVLADGDG